MSCLSILNVVCLSIVNVLFMIAGTFLNAVVIISLWRSQIGKKPCYFMIRMLSCFDLGVTGITHAVIIVSAIYAYFGEVSELREKIRLYICILLQGFSLISLFVLNIERFLAITYPFFYQRVVTKAKLLSCLTAMICILVIETIVSYYKIGATDIMIIANLALFMSLFTFANYKMFIVAKSKQANEIIVLGSQAEIKKQKCFVSFKYISTCSLAVFCSLICSCPPIVHSGLCWKWETPLYGTQFLSLGLWASTSVSMSSTFNCLIFFWRNSILRREATKIFKGSHHHTGPVVSKAFTTNSG